MFASKTTDQPVMNSSLLENISTTPGRIKSAVSARGQLVVASAHYPHSEAVMEQQGLLGLFNTGFHSAVQIGKEDTDHTSHYHRTKRRRIQPKPSTTSSSTGHGLDIITD